MTDARDTGYEVLETITDPDFPIIILEVGRPALAPIDPSDLHGFAREDDDRVKRGFEEATPDQADRASQAAIRLLDDMPHRDLRKALKRLPQVVDPVRRDADDALAWGLWHDRVDGGYREGEAYAPGDLDEEYRPAIDRPVALDAYNLMAAGPDVEPSPRADPHDCRRHRLHGRAAWSVVALSRAGRAGLKPRLAARTADAGVLAAAFEVIDRAWVAERHRHV